MISTQSDALAVAQEKKQVVLFKAGNHWIFKHYFSDPEIFRELADYYDKDGYRFVLKTPGERNKALKLLERRGFDMVQLENTRGYVVKLDRYSRYGPILKDSVARIETPEWRIFLMKDKASVNEALRLGAKLVEVDVRF
jgi:hypothetical protein